jgi:hypothetical protein
MMHDVDNYFTGNRGNVLGVEKTMRKTKSVPASSSSIYKVKTKKP